MHSTLACRRGLYQGAGWAAMLRVLIDFVVDTRSNPLGRRHFRRSPLRLRSGQALRKKHKGRGTSPHSVGNARKIKARAPAQAQPIGDVASFLVMATQEISGLPFLCWVPDVQNFNGIVLRAVGDDMRQAPLQ